MQARHEGATNYMTRQHEKKILQMKDRLTKLQENVLAEKARWQAKYNNLENQLASAKDRVYVEKVKCHTLIQKQIDETERVEMMLANYAHSLQEENQELRHELACWRAFERKEGNLEVLVDLRQRLLLGEQH